MEDNKITIDGVEYDLSKAPEEEVKPILSELKMLQGIMNYKEYEYKLASTRSQALISNLKGMLDGEEG